MGVRNFGWTTLSGWALLAFLCASAAAQVSGKLVLGAYHPAPAPVKRASYNWELENGFKEVRPDKVDVRRELAVVLLGDGEAKALERIEVSFSGGSLLPSTIVARQGATVLFSNEDEIAHELYAEGLPALPAEATAPHGRRSVALPGAGAWPLRDKLVTHVRGYLRVLPNLIAVATLDADGQFTFKEVEPGNYVLKVFHGEKELSSQAIEVGQKPLSINPVTLTGTQAAN